MPRIYTATNDPLDFCIHCFPSELTATGRYGLVGEGPDGRGNCFAHDAEHPDYDGEDYKCEMCDTPLSSDDNYALAANA